MVALIGIAGLGVNIGLLYSTRRQMQTAAAADVAGLNGFTNGQSGVTVTVAPAATPPGPASLSYLQVDLLLVVAADFGRLFYMNVGVNSAARAGAQYGSQSVVTAADAAGMVAAATKDGSSIAGLSGKPVHLSGGIIGRGLRHQLLHAQQRRRPTSLSTPKFPFTRWCIIQAFHRRPHCRATQVQESGTGMKTPGASPWSGRRWQAGATMVEFSLVAVAFFMLVFGIIQMALAVFAYNTICSADRKAVCYAMVHRPSSANPATTSQIQQVAINAAPSLHLSTSSITVSWPSDANLPSIKDAQVKISYNYRFQIPFMSPVTLTLTATSQMLVSQ